MKEKNIKVKEKNIKTKESLSVNINLGAILKEVINNNKNEIAKRLASSLTNMECLPASVEKVLGNSFERAVIERLKDLTGFIHSDFEKYFLNNLTDKTESAIKKYLHENVELNKRIDDYLSTYLNEINFEQITTDFFNSKKELFMELFLKNMFKGKK